MYSTYRHMQKHTPLSNKVYAFMWQNIPSSDKVSVFHLTKYTTSSAKVHISHMTKYIIVWQSMSFIWQSIYIPSLDKLSAMCSVFQGMEHLSDQVISFHEVRNPSDFYLLQYLSQELCLLPSGTADPFTVLSNHPWYTTSLLARRFPSLYWAVIPDTPSPTKHDGSLNLRSGTRRWISSRYCPPLWLHPN